MSSPGTVSTSNFQLSFENIRDISQRGDLDRALSLLNELLNEILDEGSFSVSDLKQFAKYSSYQDITYYSYLVLAQKLSSLASGQFSSAATKKKTTGASRENTLRTALLLLLQLRIPKEINVNCFYLVASDDKSQKTLIKRRSEFVSLFTKGWTSLTQCDLPPDVLRQTLLSMETFILPTVKSPLLFFDFLKRCTLLGGLNALLALGGMSYLMINHGAEYPEFYQLLYSLLETPFILHTSYAQRLLRQLDMFLSSPLLPSSIAASFARRIGNLALTAPSVVCCGCLAVIHNVLVRHPPLRKMIGIGKFNQKASESSSGDDKTKRMKRASAIMDMTEKDPMKTNAENTSLWEVSTLCSHWNVDVARLAQTFTTFTTDLSLWDVSSFLTINAKEAVIVASSTNISKETPVEHFEAPSLFERPPQLDAYIPHMRRWTQTEIEKSEKMEECTQKEFGKTAPNSLIIQDDKKKVDKKKLAQSGDSLDDEFSSEAESSDDYDDQQSTSPDISNTTSSHSLVTLWHNPLSSFDFTD
ncbi:putative nucleolar complex protein 4 [Monocercomonoides exilis]|uniref:putative nucleolar complex protein 4 n=1 Tax=Monocercomonoides exilis TaxID=2049356 RepID=UPI00355A5403|nr:putative nucleolar complex protein 4 [Monocercomonoides exilis]|eukprot:MONOS_6210.1-p1 / transcript=MONOS_6210.1 / gene=MONOS_6210 / organism=Monocercomonoides_exilis_PA203 / gene_product=LOC100281607 / transcript_product=LOC100281607 / location=Mono_scaffold00192:85696-87506(+) / protein_length=528 / sequence_SO=supercontig / SO=protein_coding / is_pseudo=false